MISLRSRRTSVALFLAPALVAGATSTASPARAADPAAAQSLFDEGKQLMGEGRYTEACPKFDESQRSDPGLGTQFHLADCWQHVGRLASAWALFREVESAAHTRGETSRERVAHDRAAALEPFLSKILIAPHGAAGTPGLSIQRDGAEVGREQWGVPVPADPGPHTIAIYAPGKQPWGTGVEVPMNAAVVTVDVPPLADFADLPTAAAVPPVPAPVAPPRPLEPRRGVTSMMPEGYATSYPAPEEPVLENRGGAQKAVGWVMIGAGVAALGAGAWFTTQWANDRHDSNPHCPNDVCDSTGSQQRHEATTQGWAAIIAGGSGLAALTIGTILAATAPGPRIVSSKSASGELPGKRRRAWEVVPIMSAHQGGLGLNGVW